MSIKSPSRIVYLFTLMFFMAAPVCAGDKQEKEKLDRLWARIEDMESEMIALEHQAQSLRDAISKAGGEQRGLVRQIIHNTSAIRRGQLTLSINGKDASTRIASMGKQITEANERLERLSEQLAALKRLIEDIPKQPTFEQITPGNPEQLFAVAYSDYLHGNAALALSEFQQYADTYPDSEMADNAEYWIGEILYEQKRYEDAIDVFTHVYGIRPKGDKAAAALYKRALALAEIGRRNEAVAQLNSLIKAYPKRPESKMAKQYLKEWSQTRRP
ncbi:MAG TPA: tol-pal system protein YbgF [Blastocatellia bacterium]|nr:tol-pal system protein YbgF [Blastocatellia bacterium]